jgi:hypothetical protein
VARGVGGGGLRRHPCFHDSSFVEGDVVATEYGEAIAIFASSLYATYG